VEVIAQNAKTLVERAKSIGLKINQEKTKAMELLPNEEKNMVVDVFETVKEFKYLRSTITNNNDWNLEVMSRIREAERAYFTLHKYFK